MTTHQLLALYRLNLIPMWLIDGWCKAEVKVTVNHIGAPNPDPIAKAEKIEKELLVGEIRERLGFWIGLYAIIMILISIAFLTAMSGGSTVVVSLISLGVGVIQFITGLLISKNGVKKCQLAITSLADPRQFWNRIQLLDNRLCPKQIIHIGIIFCANKSEARAKCAQFLVDKAVNVLVLQTNNTPLCDVSHLAREEFKSDHKIFMDFDLVSEDWTEYFTEAQKQIEAEKTAKDKPATQQTGHPAHESVAVS